MMNKELDVRGSKIRMKKIKGKEMFSLTDIANKFGDQKADRKIYSWFKNHNTLDFLEAYEEENNPKVKKRALKKFIAEAKQNQYAHGLEDFEVVVGFPFISSRQKREGTWAVFEILVKFMSWISAKFEVWFIKDYKRMKLEETRNLLNSDKFYAQKNVDNLLEVLRNEQDRLGKIEKELDS